MPNDPFVDAAALSSLGPVRYLDARDQAAFDAGHAPGAVRVPLEAWDAAAKSAATGFATTAYWNEAFRTLGVGDAVTAVAYDAGAMTNAARVWFILQYFGVKAVILNGGWPALAAAGDVPTAAPSSAVTLQATAGAGAVGVVDRERSSGSSMAGRMCSTAAPERNSPARMRGAARAAVICRARAICRTPI